MARRPDGTDLQPRTDTALFAALAYRLEGVEVDKLNEWARQLGVAVGADGLRNAVKHSVRLQRTGGGGRAVQPWLLLDWRALDLFAAVVRLRLGRAGPSELAALERVKGIAELFVCGASATAVVVYERRSDRDALRARLEDFAVIDAWEEIEESRPRALIGTLRGLAREAAERERLLR